MITATGYKTVQRSGRFLTFSKILCLALSAFVGVTTFSYAAQRIVVNEARIEVNDQSQSTQRIALKNALKQVFVKLSGSTSVLKNPGVKAALTTPQTLLRSYRFTFDNEKTFYVAEFDQTKLSALLQREMLPLWSDRRPETIIWLAQDVEGAGRTLLDESQSNTLLEALVQTASERGVPMSLPLMDLTDSVNISTYDVWGRFVEPLKNASLRYNVENIIGARVYRNDPTSIPEFTQETTVSEATDSLGSYTYQSSVQTDGIDNEIALLNGDGEQYVVETEATSATLPFTMDEFADHAKRANQGDYALDWVFIGGGKQSYGSIYADSPEALGIQLIDAYSNYLSSLYAVVGVSVSEREQVTISVANVGSIESYANATSYLNSLSVVDNASLVEQSGTVATYSVSLIGTIDDFLTSLKLETKLRAVTDAQGKFVEGYSFYWSN